MAEEFIDDIIAANETVASGSNSPGKTMATEGSPDLSSPQDDDKAIVEDLNEGEKKISEADEQSSSDLAEEKTFSVEELAAQLGWNKDHKGDEKIDAATYILRSKDIQKTMKEHNKDLKNQLSGLQGSVEALKEHNERVYQADIKKLQGELITLKKEKKAAVELADVEKVEELDQQIEEVQKDINAPAKVETTIQNPDYDSWIVDNNWYLTDPEMAQYADTVADQYVGAQPKRIYALVRQKVAEVFPEKFVSGSTDNNATNKRVDDETVEKVIVPSNPVEKGTRSSDSATFTKADLSPDQLTIMNQFVKSGIMTEDQYIKDIEKLQGA